MVDAPAEDSVLFVYFFNTKVRFEEMLNLVCHDLALAVKGNARLKQIQAIHEFLYAQPECGGTGVFLIDEAKHLEDEFLADLRLLSNLEKDGRKLFQIVLVGRPELERKITQPVMRQLKQRIAIRCRVKCLQDEEIEAFITLRLQTFGYEPRLFCASAIQKIGRDSQEIPRLVNVICDNALLIAFSLSLKEVAERAAAVPAVSTRYALTAGEWSEQQISENL